MIFQIDYKTNGRYDQYFEKNQQYTDNMEHYIYDDFRIHAFLELYGYREMFENLTISPEFMKMEMPIKCDFLRLLILYEFGGIYLDADMEFNHNITELEDNLEMFGERNVFLQNGSLCFIKGLKRSKYLKYMIDQYSKRTLVVDEQMKIDRKLNIHFSELMVVPESYILKYVNHHRIHAE